MESTVESTRAHDRYAVEVDAEIVAADRTIPARTRNVSRGGLCVRTARAMLPGEDVTVSLALIFDESAMSESLAVRGRVVWCTRLAHEHHQMGVMFVGLTGDQRSYLEMFLRYLNAA